MTNTTGQAIFLYNQPGFPITIIENNAEIDLFQNAVDATTGQIIRFPYQMPNGASLTILLNAAENGNSQNQRSQARTASHGVTRRRHQTQTTTHLSRSPSTTPNTPPINNPECALAEPPACGAF